MQVDAAELASGLRRKLGHAIVGARLGQGYRLPQGYPGLSDLVRAIAEAPEGQGLVRAALSDESAVRTLAVHLESTSPGVLSPLLLHHLTIFFERLGDATADHAQHAAAGYFVRSMHLLRALLSHPTYWDEFARRTLGLAGDSADGSEATAFAQSVKGAITLQAIDRLLARVRAGADTCSALSGAAYVAIAMLHTEAQPTAARAVSPNLFDLGYQSSIESAYASALESATGPLSSTMEAAAISNATGKQRAQTLREAGTRLLAWSQADLGVATFLLSRAEDLGWELRRLSQYEALGGLYRALIPARDVVAAAVRAGDHTWAAKVAQAYCFLADVSSTLEEQIDLTETALALCPKHPMSKLLLAWFLAKKGRNMLKENPFSAEVRSKVRDMHARASELDPTDTQVIALKTELEAR
jgi:hypothetical protein